MFVILTETRKSNVQDPIVKQSVYKLSGKQVVVGMLGIYSNKAWIVLVKLDNTDLLSIVLGRPTYTLSISDPLLYVD